MTNLENSRDHGRLSGCVLTAAEAANSAQTALCAS